MSLHDHPSYGVTPSELTLHKASETTQPLQFYAPTQGISHSQASCKHESTLPIWSVDAVQQWLDAPFLELLHHAQNVHRQHWPQGDIELATLLSVKTGGFQKTAVIAHNPLTLTPGCRPKISWMWNQ